MGGAAYEIHLVEGVGPNPRRGQPVGGAAMRAPDVKQIGVHGYGYGYGDPRFKGRRGGTESAGNARMRRKAASHWATEASRL